MDHLKDNIASGQAREPCEARKDRTAVKRLGEY